MKVCLEICVKPTEADEVLAKIEALRPHITGLGNVDLCHDEGKDLIAVWIEAKPEIKKPGDLMATVSP